MGIIRRGPRRAFWGVVLFLVIGACVSGYRIERIENWQVRTVIHSEWSDDEVAENSHGIHGPFAFTVDGDGNMRVADNAQGGFVSYTPEGVKKAFLKVAEKSALSTRIESDGHGFVYGVAKDRKEVLRYSADGESSAVYSQPFGDVYFVEGIGLFGTETLYVQDIGFDHDSYTRRLVRLSPGGHAPVTLASVKKSALGERTFLEGAPIVAEVDDFVVGRDGVLCVCEASDDGFARTITKMSPSGKMARFTIRQKDTIRSCRLLGLDSVGNLYVGMVLGPDMAQVVEKYDGSGQKLSEVALKGLGGLSVCGRVDPRGNFYITRMSDTGYCIDKYALDVKTRVVPRFGAK